jgi:hypothetical protein
VISTGDFIFDELVTVDDIQNMKIKPVHDDNTASATNYDVFERDDDETGEKQSIAPVAPTAPSTAPAPAPAAPVLSTNRVENKESKSDRIKVRRSGKARVSLPIDSPLGSARTRYNLRTRLQRPSDDSDFANMIRSYIDNPMDTEDKYIDIDDFLDDAEMNSDLCNHINEGIDYVNGTEIMKESTEELLAGPDGDKWRASSSVEFNSFKEKKVFSLRKRQPGMKVHKPKLIHSIKTEDGDTRYKTRCVIAGWSLRKGIDYKETFSPTVKQESLKVVLAISVQN